MGLVWFSTFFFIVSISSFIGFYGSFSYKRKAEKWKDMICSFEDQIGGSGGGGISETTLNCTCFCKCISQIPHSLECVDRGLDHGIVPYKECTNDGCDAGTCSGNLFPFCELCQYKYYNTTMVISMGDNDPIDNPSAWFYYPMNSTDSATPINNRINEHVQCGGGSCEYNWFDCSYQPPYDTQSNGVPNNFQQDHMNTNLMRRFYMISYLCFPISGIALIIAIILIIMVCKDKWICIGRSQYVQIQNHLNQTEKQNL